MGYSKQQLKNKNNGLCICGLPVKQGKVLCKKCAHDHQYKSRETRIYRKNNSLCYACGVELVGKNRHCPDCGKKMAESVKRLVKKRQNAGLCRCGNKATIGKVCEDCWFKRTSHFNTGSTKNWLAIKDILEKQQYRCVYSQEMLVPGKNASLDHIVPKCKGGTNDIKNLQWTTNFINTKMKHHFTHDEFIACIKNIIKNIDSNLASA